MVSNVQSRISQINHIDIPSDSLVEMEMERKTAKEIMVEINE